MTTHDCDFCNLKGAARWLYTLADDRPLIGLGNDSGDVALMPDDGKWHACIGCAPRIDAKDMNGLLRRVEAHLGMVLPIGDFQIALFTAQFTTVMEFTASKKRI
ncbi:hypothetical protein G6W61_10375 [Streptomyces sp. KAI-26]|uniref:hypothetical protein n=1 Tax=Streptomyces sp. KAI-26 TaxID=1169747 RepID=UPI001587C3D2|nr:hypothetical protein [Streptomyces sp. KAI-26]NUV86611.1 hypothetical protein [Streptomyces sp. KAI-26]NUW21194.1 hypothetical protein [Streptomyces roseoviolaceus]